MEGPLISKPLLGIPLQFPNSRFPIEFPFIYSYRHTNTADNSKNESTHTSQSCVGAFTPRTAGEGKQHTYKEWPEASKLSQRLWEQRDILYNTSQGKGESLKALHRESPETFMHVKLTKLITGTPHSKGETKARCPLFHWAAAAHCTCSAEDVQTFAVYYCITGESNSNTLHRGWGDAESWRRSRPHPSELCSRPTLWWM